MQQYLKLLISQILRLFVLTQVFRFVFYFLYLNGNTFEEGNISHAWYLGLKFDLRYTLLVLIPFALMIAVKGNKIFAGRWKNISKNYLLFVYIATLLLYLLDFGHYGYLGIRVNSSVVRFASNPLISLQMVWESYPVIWGSLGIIIFAYITRLLINKNYDRCTRSEFKDESKIKYTLIIITSILFYAFGIYGAIAYYPLRWSQAMFTQNQLVSGFAINPGLNIYDTYKFKDTGFDIEATKTNFGIMANYLGIENTDTLDFRREIKGIPNQQQKPNIVVIMLESMGSSKMGLHGNPLPSTPNMDSLAMNGRFFPNFFVPGLGTARTVYTSLTGIPDVSVQKTASRNQFTIDQRTIFNDFEGYEKYYFLGGNANWANIRAVFENNIKDLNIYEEGDYDRPHSDVWGLTDYDLFYESDKILQEQHKSGKPFIAYIQTASNHRPYTIGESDGDFEVLEEKDIDMKLFEKSAYDNIDQYNAIRYLDYNIGKFIERAKEGGYFDNTIFVMFGDHDGSTRPYDFNETPWYKLGVNTHRTTMLMYGPKYIKPQIDSLPATLMDVMPTMAGYTGMEFTNYTLGLNLNDSTPSKRYAFMFMHRGSPFIAIFDGRYILQMIMASKEFNLFDTQSNSPLDDIYENVKNKSDIVELKKMLEAYHVSTKYLMFNNKK
ncbi:MAG: sulfatase-like hydrolase/transferase [Bacteroidota bacterium]